MERELNMNHARALETQENDKKRLEENRGKIIHLNRTESTKINILKNFIDFCREIETASG